MGNVLSLCLKEGMRVWGTVLVSSREVSPLLASDGHEEKSGYEVDTMTFVGSDDRLQASTSDIRDGSNTIG
jgi:hypothetical protein